MPDDVDGEEAVYPVVEITLESGRGEQGEEKVRWRIALVVCTSSGAPMR